MRMAAPAKERPPQRSLPPTARPSPRRQPNPRWYGSGPHSEGAAMRMTDGDPVCDLCNAMWPLGYTELWPAEIPGPYGPDRVTIDSFALCIDWPRRAFRST